MKPEQQAGDGARIRRGWSVTGRIGVVLLVAFALVCFGALPWSAGRVDPGDGGPLTRRFERQDVAAALRPPSWAPYRTDGTPDGVGTAVSRLHLFGTDRLGRDMLARCLVGGAISLGIGLCAAFVAVVIGTSYGMISGYSGRRIDAVMMRTVDVLYGLPNILLVVLLAVAVDGITERLGAEPSPAARQAINVGTLLFAIGGVIWLTMARVVRGQVLSLKAQPFMEACRALGIPLPRQFLRHLAPNLQGPVIVYATLTVPTAILSESFLSFLGIGVREPLPSLGNLAAMGLNELNTVEVRWWLLLWPCLFVALSLLALNFVGEDLRERFDPKRGAPGA